MVRSTSGESLPIHDPDGVLDTYDPDITIQNPRPEDALQWESIIYRYDILTDSTIELYRAPAYAIGRMTRVEDSLIFSQIENTSRVVTSLCCRSTEFRYEPNPRYLMAIESCFWGGCSNCG